MWIRSNIEYRSVIIGSRRICSRWVVKKKKKEKRSRKENRDPGQWRGGGREDRSVQRFPPVPRNLRKLISDSIRGRRCSD